MTKWPTARDRGALFFIRASTIVEPGGFTTDWSGSSAARSGCGFHHSARGEALPVEHAWFLIRKCPAPSQAPERLLPGLSR
jgi:hypothetical protein